MTTIKPSSAPWADSPYRMIEPPRVNVQEHHSHLIAVEMTHAHNALIRGLNSIILQSPHIPSSDQANYVEQDVKDLCHFVATWVKVVHHHHSTEESTFFPGLNELTGDPNYTSHPKSQHDAFEHGMAELERYAEASRAQPEKWRDVEMKRIIDSFASDLTLHLYEEIDTMLAMRNLDDAGLQKVWKATEAKAKAEGNIGMFYEMFPCILGLCDRTFDGGNPFPPFPSAFSYAIHYWFAAGSNSGPWRFCPSDFWCKPKPLFFLPENRASKV